ncbi:hypothetical protein [Saccharopolyspora hordei]|uniref:Uncharacterized protein n=1 Tax=Saccharopolyspora hordei TaxID=1838 RepID=A0A853ATP1_9PSEU|nr:hypothetical protein [Saccharopolyspora hordei]NYI86023.1 hypothetical protein [Saccharopolyspora hordei]
MERKRKVAAGTILAAAAAIVGFLADGLDVLDRFTGGADQTTSPAAPSPEPTPSEDPALIAQPSASTAPPARLEFGEPERVPWSVSDTSCGQSHEIDWDAPGTSPAADPGETDFSYGTSDCSPPSFHATHGGLVPPGTALDALACRSAAMAGALPIWVENGDVEELGLVPGAAICIVTDRDRVVRAQIDEVIALDTIGSPSFRGTATVWVPK